jgi:hypothetical protein
MNMKTLSKFALIILALAGIGFLSAASAADDNVVTVNKTTHDFGTFPETDGTKTATFVVTNNTGAPILITNVRPSCGCATSDWTKTPVEPGKTGTVTAKFDPKDRPGPFDKTVTIYTNSTPDRIVVHITGTVQ